MFSSNIAGIASLVFQARIPERLKVKMTPKLLKKA